MLCACVETTNMIKSKSCTVKLLLISSVKTMKSKNHILLTKLMMIFRISIVTITSPVLQQVSKYGLTFEVEVSPQLVCSA